MVSNVHTYPFHFAYTHVAKWRNVQLYYCEYNEKQNNNKQTSKRRDFSFKGNEWSTQIFSLLPCVPSDVIKSPVFISSTKIIKNNKIYSHVS